MGILNTVKSWFKEPESDDSEMQREIEKLTNESKYHANGMMKEEYLEKPVEKPIYSDDLFKGKPVSASGICYSEFALPNDFYNEQNTPVSG